MREEDIDWTIYHLISGNKGCTGDLLAELTGFEPQVIDASLTRLKRYCLVDVRNDTWCVCGFEEVILKNQMKDVFTDGLELSGGVIRYRPEGGEKP